MYRYNFYEHLQYKEQKKKNQRKKKPFNMFIMKIIIKNEKKNKY